MSLHATALTNETISNSERDFPNSIDEPRWARQITPVLKEIIMNVSPLTVSIQQAQEIVGLSRTTIYSLINAKRLTAVKVNRRTLVTMDSLRALIDTD